VTEFQPPMTAEPATVPQPQHQVPALTTFELRNYRRDLEHALTTLPGHADTIRAGRRSGTRHTAGDASPKTNPTPA